jgi:hypothetical protein
VVGEEELWLIMVVGGAGESLCAVTMTLSGVKYPPPPPWLTGPQIRKDAGEVSHSQDGGGGVFECC